MVREPGVHTAHADLISGATFADLYKAGVKFDGKIFDEDNRRFYTSLRVAIYRCRLGYCDKHDKNNYGRDAWKDLV